MRPNLSGERQVCLELLRESLTSVQRVAKGTMGQLYVLHVMGHRDTDQDCGSAQSDSAGRNKCKPSKASAND